MWKVIQNQFMKIMALKIWKQLSLIYAHLKTLVGPIICLQCFIASSLARTWTLIGPLKINEQILKKYSLNAPAVYTVHTVYPHLGWRETQIGHHRPITIWPIVKPWTHQISHQCDITRRQTNEGSHICLHYRGGCSRTCTYCTSWMVLVNTWAEVVEWDLLVAYPKIGILFVSTHTIHTFRVVRKRLCVFHVLSSSGINVTM